MELSAPYVRPSRHESAHLPLIPGALRRERKLNIRYTVPDQPETERIIWPIMLGFFKRSRLVVGWCELRQNFRSFRCDRIGSAIILEARYPEQRQILIQRWREQQSAHNPPASS